MRWILTILAVLAGVVVIVVAVGMLLPKEHTARSHATFDATPDSIWRALTEVEAFPSWRSDVSRVELLPSPNGRRTWREIGKNGTIMFEEVAAEPSRRLVSRIADPNLPFGGSWTYDVAADRHGTRVTITESGVVHNPIFRFMSRYVFGHHATQESFLRALGRKLGQKTEPVRG
jgi:uncharacterized protein YndB with AHSA1/START domain